MQLGDLSQRGFQFLVEREPGGVGLDQLQLTLLEGAEGLVALNLVQISLRMVAHARQQLEFVRQFHQVVIRSGRERVTLDLRFLLGGQHKNRDLAGGWMAAILADQLQSLNARHH